MNESSFKSLLIGCGNIGATYDLSSDDIQTHAKIYSKLNFRVDFIEPDQEIANQVMQRYKFNRINYEEVDYARYDCISISTPTEYHFLYLLDAMKANVPLIICEKPISYKEEELNKLASTYERSSSKVLVNYIRRFQADYIELKQIVSEFNEQVQLVTCNYYKGLLNYASHSIDIINFLVPFNLENSCLIETHRKYDFFTEDPTISFHGNCEGIDYYFNGLEINYPMFEIDLIFSSYRVQIVDSGNLITVSKKGKVIWRREKVLNNYMIDVLQAGLRLLSKKETIDNFEESLELNRTLINLISK